MAGKYFEYLEDVVRFTFCEAEATDANQGTLDLAGNWLTITPSDSVVGGIKMSELFRRLCNLIDSAELLVDLGAGAGTPPTNLQVQKKVLITGTTFVWWPVQGGNLAPVVSSQNAPVALGSLAGARAIRLYGSGGTGFNATHKWAASTIIIKAPLPSLILSSYYRQIDKTSIAAE
jgi:hypothetical protein